MHRLVLLLLLCLVLAPAPRAATFDPALTWRTIETEHFHITFHQGLEPLAEELTHLAEEVWEELTADMQWAPRRRVEVLLIDRTDAANGYASSVPYPRIVLFATAPQEDSTLSHFEDWTRTLFIHELTHVLHLDANHGLVRIARGLVGRIASTNQISPRWMVEGLGTYQETNHTTGGRGRSPFVDMILRTSVIEGDFPPLGNLDGFQPDPPAGNLRYLFGEAFMRYVADRQGEDVWTRWIHTYGSGIPYLLPSRRVFGERLVPLYRDWRAHLETRYGAQVEALDAEGLREGRRISTPEASCTAPSFAPDGEKLVWSCHDLRTGPAIWMADGAGDDPEILLDKRAAKSFTWRADSAAFVYAGTHIVNRFNFWSDIFLYELDRERPSLLTAGRRARDPDFSPDGSRLVTVTNRAQNNQLEVMTVDRRMVPLTDFDDGTQLATPRFSPDGRVLALSVWDRGRWDLWLYDPEGTPLRRLTSGPTVDRDPRWSADGRWLFFASDRSGIPNIYAIEVATERLWQVTNVRTGAVHPAPHPEGDRLAYMQYSPEGWEVRVLDLDPEDFLDRGLLPRPLTHNPPIHTLTGPVGAAPAVSTAWESGDPPEGRVRTGPPPGGLVLPGVDPVTGRADVLPLRQSPEEQVDTWDQVVGVDVFGEEEDYPFTIEPRRYNPLPTLLPRFYLPYLQTTPWPSSRFEALPFGLQLSAASASSDMVAHHGWSAALSYRTDADFLGGSANYTLNRFLPVYSIGVSRRAVAYPMFLVDESGREPELVRARDPYWERRHTASLVVSYPYRPRTTIFGSYQITFRDAKDPLPEDVYEPAVPIQGRIGRLSGGWRYSWSQPTRYAISPEDGRIFSVVGSLLHPALGTRVQPPGEVPEDLTQLQVTSELREYVVNPWIPNHVLAMRVAGGVTLGATSFLGNYQLGGNIGDGAFYATPDEFRMLRGFPFAATVGDMYWLAGAEYRLPLWRIHRGFGTVPAYLRHLTAHLFVDAGNAFTGVAEARDLLSGSLVGAGAELRLSTILGWNLGMTGRLGYAVGLTPGGYAPTDPGAFYFRLGGSF